MTDTFASARRPLAARPWPLQPLLDVTGVGTPWRLASICRASGSVVCRAADLGCTDLQADTWAVRCGYHPSEVWGWEPWIAAAARLGHLAA